MTPAAGGLRAELSKSHILPFSISLCPKLGFVIRNVGRRIGTDFGARPEIPRSREQLSELIGRLPLKEIVRESTDVIERMCIEAALELTGDNRATAAEVLGLSRQSLYVKLRRFGLASAGEFNENSVE